MQILALLDANHPKRVLKSGGARRVWTLDSPIGLLLVKDYHTKGGFERLREILCGSRARREWVRLRRFEEGGVPVPPPVLWAERQDSKSSPRRVVITRFMENSSTLDEFLQSPNRSQQGWKIARKAGEALARMHAIGARHDDLHAGNLLVSEAGGEPAVLILDLHEVRLRGRLSWNGRLKNLASLYGGLRRSLTLREKQHALQAYLKANTDWNPPFRTEREARQSMGRALEIFGRRFFRKHCLGRISKCEESGKRFQRISPGEYRGWVRSDRLFPELIEKLTDPNAWLASEDAVILKHTPTTTVARVAFSDKHPPLFFKRYNRKDWWERLKNLFRPSRALKVWRAGYGLEVMGIPTPRTAVMLERKSGPILLASFILTDWTEGGVGLDDFWNERCGAGSPNPLLHWERKALRSAVARLFADLHDMGISHGDLKGRNILLDPSEPAPFAPRFVDLDAIRLSPLRFKRSRINDLSRLLFSVYASATVSDRVRFFREYCRESPDVWANRREWWRRIAERTVRKLREKGIEP